MGEFISVMAVSCIDDVFCDVSHYPPALTISPPLFCDALDLRGVAIDVPLRADHATIICSQHFAQL